jgi:hypothetical protein
LCEEWLSINSTWPAPFVLRYWCWEQANIATTYVHKIWDVPPRYDLCIQHCTSQRAAVPVRTRCFLYLYCCTWTWLTGPRLYLSPLSRRKQHEKEWCHRVRINSCCCLLRQSKSIYAILVR